MTAAVTTPFHDYSLNFVCKSLLSGGIAGMCAKTAVAPLDRIKILLQAQSRVYSQHGVFSGLSAIVKTESVAALYKGNGAQMVRIFPYASLQFTSFEAYKRALEGVQGGRFVAGAGAGITAVFCTYPLDTLRARLAFHVDGPRLGLQETALKIYRTEGGLRALYRGFVPTITGMVPYAGLSFHCFELFKTLALKHAPKKAGKTVDGRNYTLTLPFKLLCGGVAGAVAQTFSYPLDVTRRRMQLAHLDPATTKFGEGMIKTLTLIYRENGIVKGLYRGMSINYLRAIPMVAVSFTTYEVVKQLLDLDTAIDIKTG